MVSEDFVSSTNNMGIFSTQIAEMSLQVCGCCGWSKVTTYQGLRVHQGMMGCTPRGASIPEPQQQYMWGFVGQIKADVSYNLDVWKTVKIGGLPKGFF